MKRIHLRYPAISKLSTLLFLILVFTACDEGDKEYNQIVDFFDANYKGLTISSYDCIVVINEEGECMTCNNTFSLAMSNFIDNDNILFLISSAGGTIDISNYLADKERDNIALDFGRKFADLELIDHCAIINLEQNCIDTIIEIDLTNLQENVDLFTSMYSSN